MDQKTREAVIGQDMNRMGPPHRLPTHPGASSKPRPTVREAVPATDPVDALVSRVMADMAREQEELDSRKSENLNEFLLDQVAGRVG